PLLPAAVAPLAPGEGGGLSEALRLRPARTVPHTDRDDGVLRRALHRVPGPRRVSERLLADGRPARRPRGPGADDRRRGRSGDSDRGSRGGRPPAGARDHEGTGRRTLRLRRGFLPGLLARPAAPNGARRPRLNRLSAPSAFALLLESRRPAAAPGQHLALDHRASGNRDGIALEPAEHFARRADLDLAPSDHVAVDRAR